MIGARSFFKSACVALVVIAASFARAQMGGAMAAQVAKSNGACRELGTWAPQWANVQGYWNLNEGGAATVAQDSSPSRNKTFDPAVNVTWGAKGKMNRAAHFNGVDSGVVVTDPVKIGSSMTGSFTMAAWFKLDRLAHPDCASTSNSSICSAGIFQRQGYHSGLVIKFDGKLNFGSWFDNNGTRTATAASSGSALSINTWYHAVGVVDRTNMVLNLYVNGVLAQSIPISYPNYAFPANATLTIGAADLSQTLDPNKFRWPLLGDVDEAAIWNVALTAAEVATIYSQQSAGCQN